MTKQGNHATEEDRLRASEQQLKAANEQLRTDQERLKQFAHKLGERIKELNCVYGLSRLVERHDITLEEIFQGLAELIPPSWQYPEITVARITFGDRQFKSDNFRKTTWTQSVDIKVRGQKAGTIEVCYLKEKPLIDEGPFLKEERNLINSISRILSEEIERRQAEERLVIANQQLNASNQQLKASNRELKAANKQLRAYQEQLRSLASQLSLVEERKRREMATLLHDDITQALILMKMKLGELSEAMRSPEAATIADGIGECVDDLIQKARTLIFDLSSPILYEVGLGAAIRGWLTREIETKHGIVTEFADDGSAKQLAEDMLIQLFRSVREVLTNVVKHAQAKNVKVSIQKEEDKVRIVIQDDGIGFKISTSRIAFGEKGGYGLFSVRECLRRLGGHMNIESKKGEGTTIVLTAPLKLRNEPLNKG